MVMMVVVSVFTAKAQLTYGVGAAVGTKMGVADDGSDKMGFGLHARADYALEKFDLSGGLTYYFPSVPSGMDLTAFQLNFDGHYGFLKQEAMTVYGLAGLNYSYLKASVDFMGATISSDDSKIGFDLGAGVKFNKFFVEAKYDSGFEQMALTAGIMF